MHDSGSGLAPAGDGWFVVNVRDVEWWVTDKFGSGAGFESEDRRFPQLGINVNVLQPGEPSCYYHAESQQEDFLVLHGQCRLLVDEDERLLRTWDFVHCPPGTRHVFVGAGQDPCVILMVGTRSPDEEILYPVSELAQRYGAGVQVQTHSPQQAYAEFERPRRGRPAYWDRLPWA